MRSILLQELALGVEVYLTNDSETGARCIVPDWVDDTTRAKIMTLIGEAVSKTPGMIAVMLRQNLAAKVRR